METPKFIFRNHTLIERDRILSVRYDYSPAFWCCAEKWSLDVTVATVPSGIVSDSGSSDASTHTFTFHYDSKEERDKDLVVFRGIADKNMKLYK